MNKSIFLKDPTEIKILKEISKEGFTFENFYKEFGRKALLRAMEISNRQEKLKNLKKAKYDI